MSACRALCLVAVAAVLACAARVGADEPPNPIVTQIKETVSDPSKTFTLLVHLKTKDGAGDKLETAFAKAAKKARKEKGCGRYELNRDPKDATHYLVYERWDGVPAIEAHLKAPHTTALLMELRDILDGAPKFDVLLPAGE